LSRVVGSAHEKEAIAVRRDVWTAVSKYRSSNEKGREKRNREKRVKIGFHGYSFGLGPMILEIMFKINLRRRERLLGSSMGESYSYREYS
jgi:hypothetical protein